MNRVELEKKINNHFQYVTFVKPFLAICDLLQSQPFNIVSNKTLPASTVLAGGAITSILNNQTPNDWDIYPLAVHLLTSDTKSKTSFVVKLLNSYHRYLVDTYPKYKVCISFLDFDYLPSSDESGFPQLNGRNAGIIQFKVWSEEEGGDPIFLQVIMIPSSVITTTNFFENFQIELDRYDPARGNYQTTSYTHELSSGTISHHSYYTDSFSYFNSFYYHIVSPYTIIRSFDFTIISSMIYNGQLYILNEEDFFNHNMHGQLHLNSEHFNITNFSFRVKKYCSRGYTIDRDTYQKVILKQQEALKKQKTEIQRLSLVPISYIKKRKEFSFAYISDPESQGIVFTSTCTFME